MSFNQASAASSPTRCYNLIPRGKAMGNHTREKFPRENYNREDNLHCNRRRSDLSMALEEEERENE